MKHYSRIIALPVFILALFITLNFIWSALNWPTTDELLILAKGWFDLYGLPVVFLSSIVEGLLLIGGYFPGAFIIVVGVILSDSVSQAGSVVLVAGSGLFIAHTLNYTLGRYGWHALLVKFGLKTAMDEAKGKLERKGPLAIFLSYWMPSIASLTDTASGIIGMPFRKFAFFSVLSTFFWATVVGAIVYNLGDKVLQVVAPSSGRSKVLYVIIGVWIALLLLADYWERKDGEK